MIISVRVLLPAKAKSPREATEVGIETEVRLLLRNAETPMEVTEEGIVSDVKPLPLNASSAMEVNEEGIYKSLPITTPDEFLRVVMTEPFVSFSISLPLWVLKAADAGNALLLVPRSRAWEMITSVRPLFPAKAKSPRDVTVDGMEIEVRLLLRNAEAPMEVTEEGIVSDVKPLSLNALSPMEVNEEGMYNSLLITAPDEFFRIVITEPFVSFSISPPPWVLKAADVGNALLLMPRSRAWEMITSLRPLLPAKARSPREVTVDGMEIEVSLLS